MKFSRFLTVVLCCLCFTISSYAQDFPYRKKYPNTPTVEVAELKAGYDKGEFIIVDVRSSIEYGVIHPKNAIHIALSSPKFIQNLKKVADASPGKKLALYCNGVTCLKSYEGAKKALAEGIKGAYAFDGGIPAWANAYPGDTLLLGKQITDPEKQLIPKSTFKSYCIEFDEFKQLASKGAVVIDARDGVQKSQKLPGLKGAKNIPFDKLIPNVITKGRMKDKQLLIFDQVGKQVRWLMYYMVENGYQDYKFLKGGATAVLKEQDYR